MFWLRDWSGGEADYRRALVLSPRDAPTQRRLGLLLASRGRVAEGLAAVERATELDPLDSTNWLWIGILRAAGGRLDLAVAAQRRALEIAPESKDSHAALATYALLERRPRDALAELPALTTSSRLFVVAVAEHELGHAEASQRALDELIARHAHNDAYEIAAIHAWRGDRDSAFEWLERALDQELWDVKFNPLWRTLHGDPRWNALLRRMQLPVD
jgi:serine/threonine-protein kinase